VSRIFGIGRAEAFPELVSGGELVRVDRDLPSLHVVAKVVEHLKVSTSPRCKFLLFLSSGPEIFRDDRFVSIFATDRLLIRGALPAFTNQSRR